MPDRERVIVGLEIQRDEMCGSSFCDICPYFNGGEGANAQCGFEDLCNDAIRLIQGAPEIVRCQDCKYWDKLVLNMDGDGVCRADNTILVTHPGWYCADGEKKVK